MQGQIKKSHNLGIDARDSVQVIHLITRNRGKELIIPDDVDTPVDDELSSSSSSSLSFSPTKNAQESTKVKSRKRPLHLPALSDAVSGITRKAWREGGRRQN